MGTPFAITTATFTLGGQAYCASEFDYTYDTEILSFQCLSETNPQTFPGQEQMSGTATIAYDSDGLDQLWGASGTLTIVITKSTTGTITLSGTVTVGSVNATFSKGDVPQASISWTADGAFTEVVA